MKTPHPDIVRPVIVIHKEFIANADSSRIWEIIADINNWGRWNPSIDHAVIYGPFSNGARFKFSSGKWDFDSIIEEIEFGKKVVFKCSTIGLKMTLSVNIQEPQAQTIIVIDISASGWLCKVFKKAIARELDEIVATTIQSLKAITGKKGGEETKPN